jgi:hypothetical protein
MANMRVVQKRNPYIRYCELCDVLYKPTGKFQKICVECSIKQRIVAIAKTRKTLTKLGGNEKNGE